MTYQKLKQLLKTDIAGQWVIRDSRDDFYPDPLNFSDIGKDVSAYLEKRTHRLLQIDSISHLMAYVPKKSGMLREAIWLHPVHRILYMACLRHFGARIDAKLLRQSYSYRFGQNEDLDTYPFTNTMDHWRQFQNGFREASLSGETNAILITDIAAFYDHIECDHMCEKIQCILSPAFNEDDKVVLSLLQQLLKMWSSQGYGIPQNLDASSFFGSFYLHSVDSEMVGKRYKYFRYVDDIRVVANSKKQALRALHDLQSALAKQRLFLATDKTRIIERGSKEFERLMDVTDDKFIGEVEAAAYSCSEKTIRTLTKPLLDRLVFHAGDDGDERKFRAFANRLLDFADFDGMEDEIHPMIVDFAVKKLRQSPERSHDWVKLLSVSVGEKAVSAARDLLLTDPSLYDWQRFHLWRLLLHCKDTLPNDLLEHAIAAAGNNVFALDSAQAIVCAGKFGDNTLRERLFSQFFVSSQPYAIQRATLIAVQELPKVTREKFFARAVDINSDHLELTRFLCELNLPDYGNRIRGKRKFKDVPLEVTPTVLSGVGKVGGNIVRYAIGGGDYDYN